MKKLAMIGATAFLASTFAPAVSAAFAQGTAPSTELPRDAGQLPARVEPGGDGIAANGRCGGVSDGTGQRRCGDATGGPSGGSAGARN